MSIMCIKWRSCLVLNLLFHNAISTLIMRLVLKVKYLSSVSKISILRHFNKVAIYINRISLRSYRVWNITRNGRENAEMGKAHFSVLKMGKVRRLLKVSFFFTPILGEDYKNVVFSRCVVKDICVQLARYIQDSFCHC